MLRGTAVLGPGRFRSSIHPSAWKVNSANFAKERFRDLAHKRDTLRFGGEYDAFVTNH